MGKTFKRKIKKILILTPDFPPEVGGIQNLMLNLCKSLVKSGYEIEILTTKIKTKKNFSDISNFKTVRINWFFKKKSFIITSLFYIPYLITKKYDLVISGHILSTPLGLIIKKIKNIPLFTYTHALEIMNGNYERIIKFLLKNSDRNIAVSGFTADFIRKKGLRNVVIINPPIDLEKFTYEIYDKERLKNILGFNKKIIILTISRCDSKEKYKGIDTVISIMPELIKKFPEIIYIVVGKGDDLPRLKKLSKEYGVNSVVIFTGFIEDTDLIKYLKIADIYIMVSKEIKENKILKAEGFGIVFLEAQTMGVPVIGGKSGGIPDIIMDYKTGLLVNPDEPIDIQRKIEILIKNDKLRKKLVKNARARILKQFTIDYYSTKIKEVIEEL